MECHFQSQFITWPFQSWFIQTKHTHNLPRFSRSMLKPFQPEVFVWQTGSVYIIYIYIYIRTHVCTPRSKLFIPSLRAHQYRWRPSRKGCVCCSSKANWNFSQNVERRKRGIYIWTNRQADRRSNQNAMLQRSNRRRRREVLLHIYPWMLFFLQQMEENKMNSTPKN